jgi:hypothetical protein
VPNGSLSPQEISVIENRTGNKEWTLAIKITKRRHIKHTRYRTKRTLSFL